MMKQMSNWVGIVRNQILRVREMRYKYKTKEVEWKS